MTKKPELKGESKLARTLELDEVDELAKTLELVGGGELAENPELDKVDELTKTPKLDKRGELAERPKLDEVKFVFAAIIWVAPLPPQSTATTFGIIAPSNKKEGGKGTLPPPTDEVRGGIPPGKLRPFLFVVNGSFTPWIWQGPGQQEFRREPLCLCLLWQRRRHHPGGVRFATL